MSKGVSGLVFEREGHIYRYQGRRILSVTQHLDAANLSTLDDVPLEMRAFALQRGQLVHEACALYDDGRLNLATLDPILRPYVDAWVGFSDAVDAVTDAVEERLLGQGGRWAGTLDWRGSIMGYPRVILDRKCGEEFSPAARWQLSGYQEPVEEATGERWLRGVVLLRPNGKARLVTIPETGWTHQTLVDVEDAQDRGIFRAVVCVNEARMHRLKRTGLERREEES